VPSDRRAVGISLHERLHEVLRLEARRNRRRGVDGVISAAAGSRFDMNHTWSAARSGDDDELQELVLKGFHDLQYHAPVFVHPAEGAAV
jgi:hypothetical protein